MADKAIDQMISAFATGCLGKEDFIQFKKYLQEGSEVPKAKLGVQQTVMALIPIILEIEQPDEKLKEQLAKKIIGIQKKNKPRDVKKAEPELVPASEPPVEEPPVEELPVEELPVEELPVEEPLVEEPLVEEPPVKKDLPKAEIKQKPLRDSDIPQPPSGDPPVTIEPAQVKTSRSKTPWTFFISMLIMLIISTVYFMKLNLDLEAQVVEIKNQLFGLQLEIANSNEFINDHLDLIEFLNYKDVKIVNLLPMAGLEGSWGKLLISFESGEGMLQLRNMPFLENDEVYQVWMISKDVAYPLSSIITRGDVEYYNISNIPYLPAEDINLFRVTKEARAGVLVPKGTTFLYGIFLKETNRGRR